MLTESPQLLPTKDSTDWRCFKLVVGGESMCILLQLQVWNAVVVADNSWLCGSTVQSSWTVCLDQPVWLWWSHWMITMVSPMKCLVLTKFRYLFPNSIAKTFPYCKNLYIFCVSPAWSQYTNGTGILDASKVGWRKFIKIKVTEHRHCVMGLFL